MAFVIAKKKYRGHPAHKVREIRSMVENELCGWSIYPDQLPAMVARMRRKLTERRAVVPTGEAGDTRIICELLKVIGLPAEPTKRKKR